MGCCDNKSNGSKATVVSGRLCYCFEYSEEDFKNALRDNREDLLVAEIKAKMKDPGCFCEQANPSGKCCLTTIQKFIEDNSNT